MVNGITFASQLVTSANMAHYMWTFLNHNNGVTKGCVPTPAQGTTINISPGYFMVFGRMVQIVGTETLTAPTVVSGVLYCLLVFEIDLTKVNTEEEFNQGYFRFLTSTSNYPSFNQEDLDDGGTLYQLPFCQFQKTPQGISAFSDLRPILDLNAIFSTAAANLMSARSQYNSFFNEKKDEIEQEISDLQAENYLKLDVARRVQTVRIESTDWMEVNGSNPTAYACVVQQTSGGGALAVRAIDNPIIAKSANAADVPMSTVRAQRRAFSLISRVVTGDGYLEFYTAPGSGRPSVGIYVDIKGV